MKQNKGTFRLKRNTSKVLLPRFFKEITYILTAQGAKDLGSADAWKKFQLFTFHTYNPGLHLNTDLHVWQARNYNLFRS